MTLLVITTIGVYFVSRLSSRGSKYATMTGKGFRPRRNRPRPWRWFAAAIFIAYFLLIVVLPLRCCCGRRFQRFYSVPSWQALHNLTLDPYRFIFSYPNLVRSVWNTLILSFGSATLIMLVTSVICWIVVKTRLPGRWLLRQRRLAADGLSGLVLGLSIIDLLLNFDIGNLRDDLDHVHRLRHPLHALRLALQHDFDAADPQGARGIAAMSGASWGTTFRRIILPLLKPGLVAGWIYVMIVSIRELSSSILLYSPGTEVLSITNLGIVENGQYVELSALACCSSWRSSFW